MSWLCRMVVLAATVATVVLCGEYCDDFEDNGDFGKFWDNTGQDLQGVWKPTSYKELKKTIPDFPEPDYGDTILYLTPPSGGTGASACLETLDRFLFPNGSTFSFRYWLHPKYEGAGTLQVKLAKDTAEGETILDLSSESTPTVFEWRTASASIPSSTGDDSNQIMIFASLYSEGHIAIDNIRIIGPDGLDHPCTRVTTTPDTTTTANPTTTISPSTTPNPDTGYCDDFEDGDFGQFWERSPWHSGAQWKASSYTDLKETVPDFPEPASGQTVVYLTPDGSHQISQTAILEMKKDLVFPKGSTISFRYWLRSPAPGMAMVDVKRFVEFSPDPYPFLSLKSHGPSQKWLDSGELLIPPPSDRAKIVISGWHDGSQKSDIAIDDIRIKGPEGLDHPCRATNATEQPRAAGGRAVLPSTKSDPASSAGHRRST